MLRSRYFPLFLALASLLLPACGHKNAQLVEDAPLISQSFTDAFGRKLSLERPPQRIVSLSADITEGLYAIGAESRVAGVSHDSDYPKGTGSKPYVITYPEFDLPAVVELKPDLVLASTEIHDQRIAEFFDRYKIPLFFFNSSSLKDVFANIQTLGKMTGMEAKADQIADSLSLRTKSIADSTVGQIRYNTAIVLGIDPITVVGSRSFLHDLLEKAGGKNAFATSPDRYPAVTEQEFIQAAPEYVLMISRNDKAWNELVGNHPQIHNQTPASQNNKVFLLEPEILVRPGPRIVEGLAYVTRLLHSRVTVDE